MKASSCYSEESHGNNILTAIINVIGYLRRYQNLTITEARLSDEFSDADSFKENLAIVQLAINDTATHIWYHYNE